MSLVSAIIDEAAIYIGLIQPGGSLSSALQADFLLRLQQMWLSWGTEEATSNAQYHQTLTITAGLDSYTFGTGGTLTATATPVKIMGARSVLGNFSNPVKVVSFAQFDAMTGSAIGQTAQLAGIMAADNSYPSINLRLFPMPATSPGSLVLDYFGALVAINSVGQTLNLAPEYELAMWTNLAMLVYPIYARAGYDPTVLASMAQNAKATIAAKNQSINAAPAAPAA